MVVLRVLLAASLLSAVACSSVSPDTSMDGNGAGPDAGAIQPPTGAVGTTVFVHTRDTLYTVNDINFDLVHIGEFGVEDSITDLAITPDGRLFGISGEALYQINATTGAATFVADVPGVLNVGLTFLPNGQLLATDKEGGVREISPDTGAVTEVGKFGGNFGTAGDLVAVADGTMFAIGEFQDESPGDSDLLLTVNTGDGVAEYVGQIGYGDVFGTAFANGRVYAFTSTGQIIEISPTTGIGVLVRSHPDISFWGAAVTPLVSVE